MNSAKVSAAKFIKQSKYKKFINDTPSKLLNLKNSEVPTYKCWKQK
jgi:hypothetical protein